VNQPIHDYQPPRATQDRVIRPSSQDNLHTHTAQHVTNADTNNDNHSFGSSTQTLTKRQGGILKSALNHKPKENKPKRVQIATRLNKVKEIERYRPTKSHRRRPAPPTSEATVDVNLGVTVNIDPTEAIATTTESNGLTFSRTKTRHSSKSPSQPSAEDEDPPSDPSAEDDEDYYEIEDDDESEDINLDVNINISPDGIDYTNGINTYSQLDLEDKLEQANTSPTKNKDSLDRKSNQQTQRGREELRRLMTILDREGELIKEGESIKSLKSVTSPNLKKSLTSLQQFSSAEDRPKSSTGQNNMQRLKTMVNSMNDLDVKVAVSLPPPDFGDKKGDIGTSTGTLVLEGMTPSPQIIKDKIFNFGFGTARKTFVSEDSAELKEDGEEGGRVTHLLKKIGDGCNVYKKSFPGGSKDCNVNAKGLV